MKNADDTDKKKGYFTYPKGGSGYGYLKKLWLIIPLFWGLVWFIIVFCIKFLFRHK